jgi:hypothetical protein
MFWIVIRPSSDSFSRANFPSPGGRAGGDLAHETRVAQISAHEHVVGDRQRRRHGERLVDGLDAGFARVDRRVEVTSLALEVDLARIGDTAPDSDLIRVDLPAPLSPITARISPGIGRSRNGRAR